MENMPTLLFITDIMSNVRVFKNKNKRVGHRNKNEHLLRAEERLVLVPEEGVAELLALDVHVQPNGHLRRCYNFKNIILKYATLYKITFETKNADINVFSRRPGGVV
jgi:hypothetical protein